VLYLGLIKSLTCRQKVRSYAAGSAYVSISVAIAHYSSVCEPHLMKLYINKVSLASISRVLVPEVVACTALSFPGLGESPPGG
jgi:hypothetical protein